jgi:hypothetical protein
VSTNITVVLVSWRSFHRISSLTCHVSHDISRVVSAVTVSHITRKEHVARRFTFPDFTYLNSTRSLLSNKRNPCSKCSCPSSAQTERGSHYVHVYIGYAAFHAPKLGNISVTFIRFYEAILDHKHIYCFKVFHILAYHFNGPYTSLILAHNH